MNNAFHDHVTSARFQLSLGSTHVRAMAAIGHRSQALASMIHPQWIAATAALEARGLVVRKQPSAVLMPGWHASYEFTRAGELVFELLQEAGLVPKRAPAKDREKVK